MQLPLQILKFTNDNISLNTYAKNFSNTAVKTFSNIKVKASTVKCLNDLIYTQG